MTIFSLSNTSSVISFILLVLAFLIAVGFSGAISAYVKYIIGDQNAMEEGYGNPNPFMHIDMIGILIFLCTKIILRNSQPFDWSWAEGVKGFFQKIFYMIGTSFSHILIAASVFIISIKIWGIYFLSLGINFMSCDQSKLIGLLKVCFPSAAPISIIIILFLLHFAFINIILSLFDLLTKIFDYVLNMYILKYVEEANWMIFLPSIGIIILFVLFENVLWKTAWNIILLIISPFYSLG